MTTNCEVDHGEGEPSKSVTQGHLNKYQQLISSNIPNKQQRTPDRNDVIRAKAWQKPRGKTSLKMYSRKPFPIKN